MAEQLWIQRTFSKEELVKLSIERNQGSRIFTLFFLSWRTNFFCVCRNLRLIILVLIEENKNEIRNHSWWKTFKIQFLRSNFWDFAAHCRLSSHNFSFFFLSLAKQYIKKLSYDWARFSAGERKQKYLKMKTNSYVSFCAKHFLFVSSSFTEGGLNVENWRNFLSSDEGEEVIELKNVKCLFLPWITIRSIDSSERLFLSRSSFTVSWFYARF